jgi:hypothetical protein
MRLMSFAVSIFALTVSASGCGIGSKNSASKVKVVVGDSDNRLSAEDAAKKGVCLLSDRINSSQASCIESTAGECMKKGTRKLAAVFASYASCKCRDIAEQSLSQRISNDKFKLVTINPAPWLDIPDSLPSDNVEFADEDGPGEDPVLIPDEMSSFFEEHPECSVAGEELLAP